MIPDGKNPVLTSYNVGTPFLAAARLPCFSSPIRSTFICLSISPFSGHVWNGRRTFERLVAELRKYRSHILTVFAPDSNPIQIDRYDPLFYIDIVRVASPGRSTQARAGVKPMIGSHHHHHKTSRFIDSQISRKDSVKLTNLTNHSRVADGGGRSGNQPRGDQSGQVESPAAENRFRISSSNHALPPLLMERGSFWLKADG